MRALRSVVDAVPTLQQLCYTEESPPSAVNRRSSMCGLLVGTSGRWLEEV
jgi:hypothetical protein